MSRLTKEDLPCRNPLCNDTVDDVLVEWSGDGYHEPVESHVYREGDDVCEICKGTTVTVTFTIAVAEHDEDELDEVTCKHEWANLIAEELRNTRLIEEATVSIDEKVNPYQP